MLFIAPLATNNETFTETYAPLFKEDLKLCSTTSGICQSSFIYLMCLESTNSTSKPQTVKCIASKRTVTVTCRSNHLWDKSQSNVYDECRLGQLIFRIDVRRYINLIILPIFLIILTSSLFKLYEYREICREFHWWIIIMLFSMKIVTISMKFIVTFLNSAEFLNHFCIYIIIATMYGYYFSMILIFILTLYIYCIIYYTETQIRVIKSSLKQVAVMSPCILIVFETAVNIIFGDRGIFSCQNQLISSQNRVIQLTLNFVIMLSILFMQISIHLHLKPLNIQTTLMSVYRIEYDVLGKRQEISHRDLRRLLCLLKYCIICYVIFFLLDSVGTSSIFLLHGEQITVLLSCEVVDSCIDIVYIGFAIKAVWFNNSLHSLEAALYKWHRLIKEATEEIDAERFFKALKIAADDKHVTDMDINSNELLPVLQ